MYQVLILILPLGTIPYISRVLGAEGIGIYSYSYSVALYFTFITMMGLNNYGNRTIASVQDDLEKRSEKFFEIFLMQAIFFTISFVLYLIYLFTLSGDRTIEFIQIIFLFSALFDINWFFFGMEQFQLTVYRNTIVKLISLILIFCLVRDYNDIYIYTFIMSTSYFISQLWLWAYIKRYVKYKKVKFKNVIKHIKPNLVLFIPVIAVSIYRIMDKIMLGNMGPLIELGYFENAEKIVNVPIALFTAVGVVMLPRMTSLLSFNDKKISEKYIDLTMFIVLGFSIGALFGIISIATEFSLLFFGDNFLKAGTIMKFLSPTIVVLAFGNVIRTQILIPNKQDRIYVFSGICGAIINLICNIILIPKFYSVGAAIGTVIAEFVVCFYQAYSIRKELKIIKYLKESIVFVLFGLIMMIFIKLIPEINNQYISLIIKIFTGGCVYGILCVLYIIKKFGCSIGIIYKNANKK